MSTENLNAIYIELDAILDTRLGVLSRLVPDIEADVLNHPYHDRLEDNFPYWNVDKETFKKLYSKRNVEDLANSRLTNLLPIVQVYVKKSLSYAGTNPFYNGTKVILNTYPYELNQSELDDIVMCLRYHLNYLVPVEVVHLSKLQMSIDWVNINNITQLFMYDPHEYLTMHSRSFNKQQLNDVSFIGAALYQESVPTEAEFKEALREIHVTNPHVNTLFEYTELLAKVFCDLNLLDSRYFSIGDPKTLSLINFMYKDELNTRKDKSTQETS